MSHITLMIEWTFLPVFSDEGYYVYIDASFPRKLNDTARLISAVINPPSEKCLSFWYHMFGTHVNTLNLYLKTHGNLGTPVWVKSGTQGNTWLPASVNLAVSSSAQVVFEAVRGTDYRGDIGLDDIRVTDGKCPPELAAACTFEDLCGYTQDGTDVFDWKQASGKTSSNKTGPANDHTYGTSSGICLSFLNYKMYFIYLCIWNSWPPADCCQTSQGATVTALA